MANKISVFTKDPYLFQKIKLCAPREATVVRDETEADILLFDIDTVGGDIPYGAVRMSRREECELSLPLKLSTVRELFKKSNVRALDIDRERHSAILHGERIKLTEVEFALFSLLYSRKDYVSREEILREVWNSEADAGVINVYVHYLREKLEIKGEKILLSSRKFGYRIDEKYIREDR
jgi:DNA-binding winged helix-turn-helix (wHTH) protein